MVWASATAAVKSVTVVSPSTSAMPTLSLLASAFIVCSFASRRSRFVRTASRGGRAEALPPRGGEPSGISPLVVPVRLAAPRSADVVRRGHPLRRVRGGDRAGRRVVGLDIADERAQAGARPVLLPPACSIQVLLQGLPQAAGTPQLGGFLDIRFEDVHLLSCGEH